MVDSFGSVLLRSSPTSPSQRESLMNSRKSPKRRTVSSFRISLHFSLAKLRCCAGSKRASGSRAPQGARPGARRAPVARCWDFLQDSLWLGLKKGPGRSAFLCIFLGFLKDSLWLGLKKVHRRWPRVFGISLNDSLWLGLKRAPFSHRAPDFAWALQKLVK